MYFPNYGLTLFPFTVKINTRDLNSAADCNNPQEFSKELKFIVFKNNRTSQINSKLLNTKHFNNNNQFTLPSSQGGLFLDRPLELIS